MTNAVLFDFKTANEEWFDKASEVYIKKINYFIQFQKISLKTNKSERDQAEIKLKIEAQELLKKLSSDDYIILFDEKGKTPDSIEFSKIIDKSINSGKKRLVFVIGGAYGVSEEIKQKAHLKISLSSMVMNHLVAETVALEQIYRAMTILKRIPYHNV